MIEDAFELEDLAPLFYLKAKLEGIEEKYKMSSIFIDEAQDYSYFQFAALKEGFETDLFTIVGDLAQGIHSYRGLNSWEPLLKDIFPNANYQALQKSYRTTVEIMNLANEILSMMDKDLPKVEPVIRHGKNHVIKRLTLPIWNKLGSNLNKIFLHLKRKSFTRLQLLAEPTENVKESIKCLKIVIFPFNY